jgi:hypothetical protein
MVFMTAASRLAARLPEEAVDRIQVPRSGAVGWKHPSLAPCTTTCTQKIADATAHWNKPPPLGGLTVGHENHAILPIETLDAHAVEFTLVSHSGIAHQDDDVAEKLKGSPSRGAGPELLRAISVLLHHQAEDAAHAPSSF